MSESAQHRPLVLIILDGWGYSNNQEHNAIYSAKTPNWDRYWQNAPKTLLECAGAGVGLPEGQMGNSEVGHMHLGAGRIVRQELSRIDNAIEDGEFAKNSCFIEAFEQAKKNNKAIHVMGLLSPGGVHSHEKHIHSLIQLAAEHGVDKLFLHAFLDGRDTPPKSAQHSLELLEQTIEQHQCGEIATIVGRYYAMDRDQRWDRIQPAYDSLTQHKGEYHAENATAALEQAYARGESDEFVATTSITTSQPAQINDGDIVIFMNFRADRARLLSRAFSEENFTEFQREKQPKLGKFLTLTQYAKTIQADVAFMPQTMTNSFGEYVAAHGLKQLRIAETEKYAHVTFFFNGGSEHVFPGEERKLIPSPNVATYNLQPEMSAPEMTATLVEAFSQQQFDVIICNYANPDMVGHTGDFDATLKAITCIDDCLGQLEEALKKVGGEMIITADHGNAEYMYNDATQQAHTAHTSTPVPFVYLGREANVCKQDGSLIDIAPTMLYLLGLAQPNEMTGRTLLSLTED